jgi:hypothetical protein
MSPATGAAGTISRRCFFTEISGPGGVVAYVWTSNVNIDYDGSPKAYGPPAKHPQDYIGNAGPDPQTGWYGVVALTVQQAAALRAKDPSHIRPQLDTNPKLEDVKHRFPVVQQAGEPAPGFYVSPSSKPANTHYPEYDQRRWLDSSSIPFGALSGMLKTIGKVSLNDFALAIRLDQNHQSGFMFKDSGGSKSWAVGECSYKVFTDLGGKGTNNNFVNAFIVFPGSGSGGNSSADMIEPAVKTRLTKLAMADNADDLPMLLSYYAQAGKNKSGLPSLKTHQSANGNGSGSQPKYYLPVVRALRSWGYHMAGSPDD